MQIAVFATVQWVLLVVPFGFAIVDGLQSGVLPASLGRPPSRPPTTDGVAELLTPILLLLAWSGCRVAEDAHMMAAMSTEQQKRPAAVVRSVNSAKCSQPSSWLDLRQAQLRAAELRAAAERLDRDLVFLPTTASSNVEAQKARESKPVRKPEQDQQSNESDEPSADSEPMLVFSHALVGEYPEGPLRILRGTLPEDAQAVELRRMMAHSEYPEDWLAKLAARSAEIVNEARRRFGPSAAAVATQQAVVRIPLHGALRRIMEFAAESERPGRVIAICAAAVAASCPLITRLLVPGGGVAELTAAAPVELTVMAAATLCHFILLCKLLLSATMITTEWHRRTLQREAWGQLMGLSNGVAGMNRFPRLAGGPSSDALITWTQGLLILSAAGSHYRHQLGQRLGVLLLFCCYSATMGLLGLTSCGISKAADGKPVSVWPVCAAVDGLISTLSVLLALRSGAALNAVSKTQCGAMRALYRRTSMELSIVSEKVESKLPQEKCKWRLEAWQLLDRTEKTLAVAIDAIEAADGLVVSARVGSGPYGYGFASRLFGHSVEQGLCLTVLGMLVLTSATLLGLMWQINR
eukprot:SAG31_NODE_4058_length_3630_cov_2.188332_2_plen_580_part_00